MKIEVIGPRTGKYTGAALSAAPDLLAAATAALNLLCDPDASSFDADRVERMLRAAIEKAGGSP
jgi:hypothetical protein